MLLQPELIRHTKKHECVIERIQKIQQTLPEHEAAVSEEEAAFTEAAEEHFAHSQLQRHYFSMRR